MCQYEDYYYACCGRTYSYSLVERCIDFDRGPTLKYVLRFRDVHSCARRGDVEIIEKPIRSRWSRSRARLFKRYQGRGKSVWKAPNEICDDCLDHPGDGVLWSIRFLFEDEVAYGKDKQDESGMDWQECLTHFSHDEYLWSIRRIFEETHDSEEIDE